MGEKLPAAEPPSDSTPSAHLPELLVNNKHVKICHLMLGTRCVSMSSVCRYHMFGVDVHRLRVVLRPSLPDADAIVLFQKDGNYGDTWNYGQVTLNLTSDAMVSDITRYSTCQMVSEVT